MGESGTADSNASQDTTSHVASVVRWCVPSCKYDGKEKRGKQTLDMTRCCFCMYWFHNECMNIKDGEKNVVWQCQSCRLVPANISKLLCEMTHLRNDLQSLENVQRTSQDSLKKIEDKCEELSKENAALKTQVTSLSLQLQQKVWQGFTNNDTQSLLIGDSLIRNVDEQKLKMTKVTSLPGAKVTDVLKHLKDTDLDYNSIVCCVGTNDCSNEEFNGDTIAKTYKDIVETVKLKVNDPKCIKLVSIPPRSDSKTYQERVDTLNACLSSIATDDGLTFINNDPTFKLGDGTPNDGYLLNDGLHLNDRGTNRLVKNMQLRVNHKAVNGNVVKKRKALNQQQTDSQQEAAPDTDWQEVSRRRRRPNRPQPQEPRMPDRGRQGIGYKERTSGNKLCWFCGETNHVSINCRHGQKIYCFQCQGLGHKAKNCTQ